jgi:trimeric autotransporter adhesin
MKNCLNVSIAAALLFASVGVSASTLSFTPAAATALPGAGNPTNPTPIQVTYNNTGSTADSIEFEITFDDTDLNVTVAAAAGVSCSAGSGLITVIAFDAGSNTIASGNLCALTFTTDAGAADGEVKNLAFQNVVVSDGGGAAVAPTTTPGTITIQAAPAATGPVLTYAPVTGSTVVSGTNITVTPSGGQAGGTSSYTCTPPAGVTVSNNPGMITTGGAAATLNVSCPAGTADASMTCTSTGGGTPVTYNVDCPAAPAPVLSSTPANGTPLTCNGTAGSTVAAAPQVSIQNTGNANMTGVACNVTGTGFTITTPPSATILPGASSNVVVSCTVPADGAPANTGSLNCTTTSPAGGALAFPLSSVAQSAAVPTQAAIVPATSIWSKVGLVGLLAVLGLLVVGFRRQH